MDKVTETNNAKVRSKKIAQVALILGIILLSFFLLTTKTKAQEAQKAGTSSYGTTGNYQSFANGYIYQSKHGTYSVYTTIRMLHERYGGTWGTYGFPTTDRYYDQTEKDYCQWFEGGKLCEHTNQVELKIRDKENSLGNAKPEGEIHQWCGTYVRDYQSIGGKKDSIIMYNPNKSEAYLITGGIWESYWKKGGCERYGYPEMDERNTGRIEGWYQDFEKATIYWSKSNEKSQPGIVEEEVKEYYHKKGGTWSYLGFPEGEKWGNKDNTKSTCGTNGIEQNFNGGKIYISKVGKVDWEYGELMDYYWNLGEVNGSLGWPSPSASIRKSNKYITFERGTLESKGWYISSYLGGCGWESVIYKEEMVEFIDNNRVRTLIINTVNVDLSNGNLITYADLDFNTIKDDVEDFEKNGYVPLVGVNGDYKEEDGDGPDGYNLQKGINEKSGDYKGSRSSLIITEDNKARISMSEESSYTAIGGGPQYVYDGEYKWEMKCYKLENEVDCDSEDFDKTRLNGEKFTENNFTSRNAMSTVGILEGGNLLIAVNDGYSRLERDGITPPEMGLFLIKNKVKDAIRFDGGPEAYLYTPQSGYINTSFLGQHNEHPTALFIFSKDLQP